MCDLLLKNLNDYHNEKPKNEDQAPKEQRG